MNIINALKNNPEFVQEYQEELYQDHSFNDTEEQDYAVDMNINNDNIDDDDDVDVHASNVDLVCKLLSYMNFFKFCHWAAPAMDIHKEIDKFYDILAEYTDAVSEVLQGIDGQFKLSDMCIRQLDSKYTLMDALNMLKQDIQNFVDDCNDDLNYAGAVDISTTFLKDIAQYAYLFRLCKWN